jgi:hypothetical protein
MNKQGETIDWDSVNEALEYAVGNIEVEFVDDSFGYEYGSISGVHRQMGYILTQDTVEIDIRVPYKAGWLPGEDEQGILRTVRCDINVEVEPLSLNVELKNGFWLVRGIFSVEEVD